MKRLWVVGFPAAALLLIVTMSGPGRAESHGEVAVVKDRFTGTKSVQLTGLNFGGQLRGAVFAVPGGSIVRLQIEYISIRWGYLYCHSLDWQLDGTPQPGPPTTHDGRVDTDSGYVIEYIAQDLTHTLFNRIATANKVRARLCNDEFDVTDEQLHSFRRFAETAGIASRKP